MPLEFFDGQAQPEALGFRPDPGILRIEPKVFQGAEAGALVAQADEAVGESGQAVGGLLQLPFRSGPIGGNDQARPVVEIIFAKEVAGTGQAVFGESPDCVPDFLVAGIIRGPGGRFNVEKKLGRPMDVDAGEVGRIEHGDRLSANCSSSVSPDQSAAPAPDAREERKDSPSGASKGRAGSKPTRLGWADRPNI